LLKIFELLRGQLGVPGGMLHSDHALEGIGQPRQRIDPVQLPELRLENLPFGENLAIVHAEHPYERCSVITLMVEPAAWHLRAAVSRAGLTHEISLRSASP
jgi:hypothetical protein